MTTAIVLLRRSTGSYDDDEYQSAFQHRYSAVKSIAPLTEQWCEQDQLTQLIERGPVLARHWGAVVTSKRAVEAVAAAFLRILPADRADALWTAWRKICWFVVGPATAKALRQLLQVEPIGEETGDAARLAPVIVQRWRATTAPESTLLFLSGRQRRDTLPLLLASANCPYYEQCVYTVEEDPELATALPVAYRQLSPRTSTVWFVFFSPSGVKVVLPILDRLRDKQSAVTWRVAAIGATTASALTVVGMSPDAVASSPSADGLLAAIEKADPAT